MGLRYARLDFTTAGDGTVSDTAPGENKTGACLVYYWID